MVVISLKGLSQMLKEKIKKEYKKSVTAKAINWLFSDNFKVEFKETRFGRVLGKLYLPSISEICTSLALIILFYEGLISKTGFNFGQLVPWFIIGAILFAKKDKFVIRKNHIYYLMFLLGSLLSGIFSIYFLGLTAKLVLLGFLIFAGFGFAFILGGLTKINIQKLIVYLSFPLTLVGLHQFMSKTQTSSLWITQGEKISTRVFAFSTSPNVFALVLSLSILLAIGLLLQEKTKIFGFIAALNLIVLIMTFSRSAWLGLVCGVVFILLVYMPKFLKFSPLALLILLFEQVRERIFIVFSSSYLLDSSLDGRLWSFINGFYIFKQFPFFGTGPGSYGGLLAVNYASPIYLLGIQKGYTALRFTDNQWLELFIQTGLVGFILFFLFIISVFWSLMSQYHKKKDIMSLVVAGILICFVVSGLFENIIEFGTVAIPIGLILGEKLSES